MRSCVLLERRRKDDGRHNSMMCAVQVVYLCACTILNTVLFFVYCSARAHPPTHLVSAAGKSNSKNDSFVLCSCCALAVMCGVACGRCTLSPILLSFMFLVLAVES